MKVKLALLTVTISTILASSAFAQCPFAQQSFGTSATAKDIYTAICPVSSVRMEARVRDQLPNAAPTVTVKIVGGSPATSTDSAEDYSSITSCFFTGMSTPVAKKTGAPPYTLEVTKSAAGTENYRLHARCFSSSNQDLGEPIMLQKQNQ